MTENTKNPNTKSLRRYSAVSQVLQLTEEGLPLSHALNLCARRNYDGHHYGASTLEKWYYRYRRLGYEGLGGTRGVTSWEALAGTRGVTSWILTNSLDLLFFFLHGKESKSRV